VRHVLLINSDKLEPIQMLANDSEVRLSVLTKPKYASLYEGIAEVWPVDDVANLLQAHQAVLNMLRQGAPPIDTVVTPLERSLLTGGFLRSYWQIEGTGYETMLGFANKWVMKSRLQRYGVPVTSFVRLDRLEDVPRFGERFGWPVVIKPAVGSGSMNTFVCESVESFERRRAEGALDIVEQSDVPWILERYVAMIAEYHCDGVVREGQVTFAAVSRYFAPVLSALSMLTGSCVLEENDPALVEILALHRKAVNALGLQNGVTHLEVFETEDAYLVGEITCRPGGGGVTDVVQKQFGISLWKEFVRVDLQGSSQGQRAVRVKGVVGWCGLPGKNGVIKQQTSMEKWMKVPQVIDASIYYDVGERVLEKQTSVFFSGILSFRLDQSSELPEFLEKVKRLYVLEVE